MSATHGAAGERGGGRGEAGKGGRWRGVGLDLPRGPPREVGLGLSAFRRHCLRQRAVDGATSPSPFLRVPLRNIEGCLTRH